jgi:peptidoglycan L-alanyl-D-glutamate endopeptidase CwlK
VPSFGPASLTQLGTCDQRLQRLFLDVVQFWDCTVLEGKRSEAQQQINVAHGVSKTMDSKHVYPLGALSLAVDVAPYPVKWTDLNRFYAFGGFVIGTARKLGLTVRWGGDWDSDRDFSDQHFNDLPHFEITD